jgi:AcrR family transcriptional regulator
VAIADHKAHAPDSAAGGNGGIGRREKRKLEIRARIQDAAYALFKQQGIRDTSVEQICEAADVARRTFYGYYPDKQALLRALSHSRVFTTATGLKEEIMANHHTTRERVAAMISFIENNISNYTDIDRKLVLIPPASFEDENPLRDISQGIQAQFREVFRAGIENGDLSGRFSADILSEMVMGTFNNMMVSWASDPNYPIFEKLEEARGLFDHILSEN